MAKPRLLSDKTLNTLRGKASIGHATPAELMQVFGHIDTLEMRLDALDNEDFFGTEGWRHSFGAPE